VLRWFLFHKFEVEDFYFMIEKITERKMFLKCLSNETKKEKKEK